jgi:hypothetical protein
MLTMKIDAIFQLIESIHYVMLSSFGVFTLCYLTESTKNAIGNCSQFLISLYSTEVDACENINQKVDVCCLFACERISSLTLFNESSSSIPFMQKKQQQQKR